MEIKAAMHKEHNKQTFNIRLVKQILAYDNEF